DLHKAVGPGGSNHLAVRVDGAKRHAADFVAVLLEGQDFLTFMSAERSRVPDANGSVGAGRGEAAVRTERHTPAPAGVSTQAQHLPPGRRFPDAHRLVFAPRGEAAALAVAGAESTV